MSPVAKARVSSGWVDTILTGYAMVGGLMVPFGPGGGPSLEALAWPSPPQDTEENDGTQNYNMGVRFTVTDAQDCAGVEWRVPDNVATPAGGFFAASVWDMDTTRLAYVEFEPVEGDYQQILFDAPVTLDPADYVAAIYTQTYVYRSGTPAGIQTPSGNVTAVQGRLATYGGGAATAPFPDQTTNLQLYVSPLMVV